MDAVEAFLVPAAQNIGAPPSPDLRAEREEARRRLRELNGMIRDELDGI